VLLDVPQPTRAQRATKLTRDKRSLRIVFRLMERVAAPT
jgi:hypothetical protein